MTKRVAFIIESSNRMKRAAAKQFYRGRYSRWINHVIDYMEVRNFPEEDIFFLSFHGNRIIPFTAEIEDYPKRSGEVAKTDQKVLAQSIIEFLQKQYDPRTIIEIHAGKNVYEELKPLLELYGYGYKVFAEEEALSSKHKPYVELMEQEKKYRRLKDMQKEKLFFSSLLEYRNIQEAEQILDLIGFQSEHYGRVVEEIVEEVREQLRNYYQRSKDERKALSDFEAQSEEDSEFKHVESFFRGIRGPADLTKNLDQYQAIKSKCGKTLAKFTRYLIKHEYVIKTERNISDALFRLQIALLK
ncbi:hypothetical protein ACFYU8_18295 [Brevibacillus sp. NPDC003359]|uniref:hypothetical protein n=1 Tax=unclassified Brevibacillus TaxID=2684853 RepID=UPI003690A03A